MTQEEKTLLLQDLCARLPYEVKGKVETTDGNGKEIEDEGVLNSVFINEFGKIYICIESMEYELDDFKPYLRPMSCLTLEEFQGLRSICPHANFNQTNDSGWIVGINGSDYGRISLVDEISRFINWLYAHHLDWCGLIPMGLALPAKEGMYNFN